VLHYGDLTDSTNLIRIIQQVQPDEIYNLAAMSHVAVSFETPSTPPTPTASARCASSRRSASSASRRRRASTRRARPSCTGSCRRSPQNETTPFYPRSPYAVAKLYAYWITVNYREAYGLYACNGILFNHESPVRGETFVTRKITRALTRIALGCRTACTSATSRRCATGATPRTTSRCSG
jgi:GDPmannose 4,6-dehydratase